MLLNRLRPSRTIFSLSFPALFSTMADTPPAPSGPAPSIRSYTSRHVSFPYTEADFRRADESSDTDFYASPRFVTHIDDNAIRILGEYYAENLPRSGRILDLCSSWISHFPKELEEAAMKAQRMPAGPLSHLKLLPSTRQPVSSVSTT